MTPQESFIDFLVKDGYVTPIQLLKSSQIHAQQGGDLLQILVMMDFITWEELHLAQRKHQQWLSLLQPQTPSSSLPLSPPPSPFPAISYRTPAHDGVPAGIEPYTTFGWQRLDPVISMAPPTGVLTHEDVVPESNDVIDDINQSSPKHSAFSHVSPQMQEDPYAEQDPLESLAPPTEIEDHSHLLFLAQAVTAPIIRPPSRVSQTQDRLATFQPPPTPADAVISLAGTAQKPHSSPLMQTMAYSSSPFSASSQDTDSSVLALPSDTNPLAHEEQVPSQEIIDSLDELFEQVMVSESPETDGSDVSAVSSPEDVSVSHSHPTHDAMKTLATETVFPELLLSAQADKLFGPKESSPSHTDHIVPALPTSLSQQHQAASDSDDDIILLSPSSPSGVQHNDPLLGQSIDQRFLVQEKIADYVGYSLYRIFDQHLGRTLSLRRMPAFAFITNQQMFRFKKEAEQLLSLHHPNIVSVLAYGVYSTWGAYLIHDHLEGNTLREYIFQQHQQQPPLTVGDLPPLFEKICVALDQLHQRSIPHRNLSLSSMQWESGSTKTLAQIKLIPTGITPMVFSELTMPWMLALHANYPVGLCPELLHSFPADLTPRADIYALGLILFQLLTGKSAFSGETLLQLLQQHAYAQHLPLSVVAPDTPYPTSLQVLINTSLSKDPSRRPPSSLLWLDALRHAAQEAPHLPLSLLPSPQVTRNETDSYLQTQANQQLAQLRYPTITEPLPYRAVMTRMARILQQSKTTTMSNPALKAYISHSSSNHATSPMVANVSDTGNPSSVTRHTVSSTSLSSMGRNS